MYIKVPFSIVFKMGKKNHGAHQVLPLKALWILLYSEAIPRPTYQAPL